MSESLKDILFGVIIGLSIAFCLIFLVSSISDKENTNVDYADDDFIRYEKRCDFITGNFTWTAYYYDKDVLIKNSSRQYTSGGYYECS